MTKPLWVLEPCAGKLARTVLRGERRSNPPDLPDSIAARDAGTIEVQGK